jgi:hypothetical protein
MLAKRISATGRAEGVEMSKKKQIALDDVLAIIAPDTEPITESLITELIGQGQKKSRLIDLRDLGFAYNRERNSFVTPPQTFGSFKKSP